MVPTNDGVCMVLLLTLTSRFVALRLVSAAFVANREAIKSKAISST